MKKIFKYQLDGLHAILEMPLGSEILTVQGQGNNIVLWALVDTSKALEKREFNIYLTGEILDNLSGKYIGTVQIDLVYHIYEII